MLGIEQLLCFGFGDEAFIAEGNHLPAIVQEISNELRIMGACREEFIPVGDAEIGDEHANLEAPVLELFAGAVTSIGAVKAITTARTRMFGCYGNRQRVEDPQFFEMDPRR